MKKVISRSLEETQQIAEKWLEDIYNKYKDSDKAVTVGLSGHLGAGKTAFVKMVAKSLEIEESVTSPTFVIMKIYETYTVESREDGNVIGNGGVIGKSDDKTEGVVGKADDKDGSIASNGVAISKSPAKWKHLVHIDAYRLEKSEDLKALKLEEVVAEKNNLVMIEWPENVCYKAMEQINMKALEEAGTFGISL